MCAAKIEGRSAVYLRDDALRQGPLFFACRPATREQVLIKFTQSPSLPGPRDAPLHGPLEGKLSGQPNLFSGKLGRPHEKRAMTVGNDSTTQPEIALERKVARNAAMREPHASFAPGRGEPGRQPAIP